MELLDGMDRWNYWWCEFVLWYSRGVVVVVAAWGFGGGDGGGLVLVFVWWVRWRGRYLCGVSQR